MNDTFFGFFIGPETTLFPKGTPSFAEPGGASNRGANEGLFYPPEGMCSTLVGRNKIFVCLGTVLLRISFRKSFLLELNSSSPSALFKFHSRQLNSPLGVLSMLKN